MGVYIQPIVQGTGLHAEFNLFYDPDNAGEASRVKGLAASAVRELMGANAFFSRPYGENANIVVNRDAASLAVLSKLKDIFDPNHVMNPGKGCF
jgi:FAD/FMN-containing dehydrogenase